ncbi:MAG: UDP-N-acetylmuramate dehydrogenase [Patescibacteria group bacterium]|jgi:UDP-N-acetylmuramate dehydrogenase
MAQILNLKIKKNIPLAPLTTFKIGGPAKFFIEVKTKGELKDAVIFAEKNKEKIYIIGGGSNLLVNDAGVNGLVIKFADKSVKIAKSSLSAGAGAKLADALKAAAEKELTGLEWTAGIPRATIGGAIRGNAGAFGTSMGKYVSEAEVYDLKKNKFIKLSRAECRFKYRESIFKEKDNYLIWEASLALKKDDPEKIKNQIMENIKLRKNTPAMPSAGSVFKNLTLVEIKKANPKLAEKLIQTEVVKRGIVGAGLIIDKILDLKGKTIGNAKISEEHGNFIVNAGDATAEDVITLISFIKQQCRGKLGLELREEIQYLGF